MVAFSVSLISEPTTSCRKLWSHKCSRHKRKSKEKQYSDQKRDNCKNGKTMIYNTKLKIVQHKTHQKVMVKLIQRLWLSNDIPYDILHYRGFVLSLFLISYSQISIFISEININYKKWLIYLKCRCLKWMQICFKYKR